MQNRPPIPATIERIVLVGFMGAGKSTVGPLLAARVGWGFFDADLQLQAQQQTSIAALFSGVGEPAFRKLEAEIVAGLLDRQDVVISLGGGAIETRSTRALLEEIPGTSVVFLNASLEVLMERCELQSDAADRPVLRQRETLHQRFHSRLPHYQAAHITVNTEALNPAQAADYILDRLGEAYPPIRFNQKVIAT